jgi:hypothetical protein
MNYVLKECHRSAVEELAQQVSEQLEEVFRGDGALDDGGTALDIVSEHLHEHVAHPRLKLTVMLRELDRVRRRLEKSIDLKTHPEQLQFNVNMYLRVACVQQSLFKLGKSDQLAFGTDLQEHPQIENVNN